jgi:UDP-glucose:(heptosyl)LPS alpha-1,3-glucosyltransferase
MRIALLTRRFDSNGGGTERDLIVTAQGLRAAGHQVTIFADEIRGSAGGWDVRRVGAGPRLGRALSLMRFAWTAAPAARRAGADLVLSFARCVGADVMRSGGGAHASYLRAARKWRGPLGAAAMRISPYHQVQMMVERQAFRGAGLKRVIAVSNFVRDDLIGEFGLAPEKTVTIYNGVDLDRFRPPLDPSARAALRQKFIVPASARVVAFVGNGFARKGLGFLIEAWPLVAGGAFLLVAGSDRQTEKFARRARALNVAARVVFTGPQPNVDQIFHAADSFAMPSLFEPFGNVVMEAMACGLPAMTSAFSGVAEVLPPSMRGFRVENPDDVGEVALRLGALFDAPATLATDARATAEKFTWSRYAKELNALIESIT